MAMYYDDTELRKLFKEMDPEHRFKALKGAFRREANMVRKVAVNNLRSSGLRSADAEDMDKGIRAIVYSKSPGFEVTVKPKKKKGRAFGFHKNRQGLDKPVLMWAEAGTEMRKTKGRKSKNKGSKSLIKIMAFGLKRKGHSTGRMKRYGFLRKTNASVAHTVTHDLHKEIVTNVVKTAKKYLCE